MSESLPIAAGCLKPELTLLLGTRLAETARSFPAPEAARGSNDVALAKLPLSEPAEAVLAIEDAAVSTSWSMALKMALSVSATAALMWTLGLTLILGSLLLFWAALCGFGLILWWRKARPVEASPRTARLHLAQ